MRSTTTSDVMRVAAVLLALGASTSWAEEADRVLDGCYQPKRGGAESVSISESEQLGIYRLTLERLGWSDLPSAEKKRIQYELELAGPFQGVLVSPTTLNHTLGDFQRRGLLMTRNDEFVPSRYGCFVNGLPTLLEGTETLYPVHGTGLFAGLQAGGSVSLNGRINGCVSDPDFGNNDFRVIKARGKICFSAP